MMIKTIKVTQAMVDYVESHRSGPVHYNEDFKLEVGETCSIIGCGVEVRRFLMRKEDGISFSIPEEVTGLNVDDYKKAVEEQKHQEEIDKKRREDELKINWADVRINAAIHILGGMVADKCVRIDEEDDDQEQLQKQVRTVKRCAYTAAKYADALVEKLKGL